MNYNASPVDFELTKDMFDRGVKNSIISRAVGRGMCTIRRWRAEYEQKGTITVRARGKLSDSDVERLEGELQYGVVYHGFDNDMWTYARVNDVINKLFDKTICASTFTKLMRRMGWTRQRPAKLSDRYDEDKHSTWVKEEFENIKKSDGELLCRISGRGVRQFARTLGDYLVSPWTDAHHQDFDHATIPLCHGSHAVPRIWG